MMVWFARQPIHRKLVITSMVKTGLVLMAAILTLLTLDVVSFTRAATTDVRSLASIVADALRGAVTFDDETAMHETLSQFRLRPQVLRVCVFDDRDRLLGHYARPTYACPPLRSSLGAGRLSAMVPIVSGGTTRGWVHVERDWAPLRGRMVSAGLTSLAVLVLATGLVFVVSHRLHRNISQPIQRLAAAARAAERSDDFRAPDMPVSADEVGELVVAFQAMAARTHAAREDLTRTNESLRREIDERIRVEREHEKTIKREQEANRAKDDFLATVSHELRTPLNAIVGWSQILATTTPGPEVVAKAAESLYRNAHAQARVIDDLIDISRIVSGKLRVDAHPVDMRAVVESAIETQRADIANARVALTVSLTDEPCVIVGDRDRLKQIVWNLLSNAIKYGMGGGVSVTLRCEDPIVTLQVSDHGVGIPPAFLPHVFDRFRQADSSVTREHGGLGIGLAVARELVELHGGSITAESTGKGHGATFTVRLPGGNLRQPVPATASPLLAPSLGGLSVLAVDDNADSLEVMKVQLTDAGATVRTVGSGADALTLWRTDPPDVLLCDLAMPGMSGFELIAHIREIDRQAGRVTPAIAVTAHAAEEQVASSARAGFQGHVAKPFRREQLVRAIIAARALV